jgi:hypothetical protein
MSNDITFINYLTTFINMLSAMAEASRHDKEVATIGSLIAASAGLILNALLLVIVLSSRPMRAFSNIFIVGQIIFDILSWY